jgi:hypothetical protein
MHQSPYRLKKLAALKVKARKLYKQGLPHAKSGSSSVEATLGCFGRERVIHIVI